VSFARLRITYIGGPTALIEIGGLRLLTDPTFDPAGGEYQTPSYSLFKLQEPALDKDAIGQIDAVLLSHDHHFDNLDNSGRSFLNEVPRVLTTEVGAARLEGRAEGLAPWQSTELTKANGDRLTITATPARHGPAHADRGPCIGFIVSSNDSSDSVLYLSGDTVWYDGVAEVARRYSVAVAVLFMGAARVEGRGVPGISRSRARRESRRHAPLGKRRSCPSTTKAGLILPSTAMRSTGPSTRRGPGTVCTGCGRVLQGVLMITKRN
jgi:L-ascorbate metabolism protein UlaG (beta-lactamase superfamily)